MSYKLGITNAAADASGHFKTQDGSRYQRFTNGRIERTEPFPRKRRQRGFTARQEARAGK